jgi:predicted MFS family arabinose efflux permease
VTAAREAAGERVPRSAWLALAVLTLINLVNYIDRFIVPAVMEEIHRSELAPSNAQLGLLATAFLLVYTVTAPFFGAYGDRGHRPRLLALGVGVWSIATALGGLATSYGFLLASRTAVGVGEAAYATIAPALLADYFPASMRGRVLAIFYSATPIGAALGYVLGGQIGAHYGWRYAFFIAGVPGLVLALLALRLPESAQRSAAGEKAGFGNYLTLLKNTPYLLVILGYAAYTFGLGGISIWMPVFLERVHGLSLSDANNQLGLITVITGFAGALAGGWLGDRMLRRWREAYLWLSGWSTLLAAPFAYLAFTLPPPLYLYALFAAELLIFLSTGPVNSSILGTVAPTMRAASMALSIFAIHALGDGPSPLIIGVLTDRSSIQQAVMIIPVAVAIGGVIWLYAAWRGERSPARGAST